MRISGKGSVSLMGLGDAGHLSPDQVSFNWYTTYLALLPCSFLPDKISTEAWTRSVMFAEHRNIVPSVICLYAHSAVIFHGLPPSTQKRILQACRSLKWSAHSTITYLHYWGDTRITLQPRTRETTSPVRTSHWHSTSDVRKKSRLNTCFKWGKARFPFVAARQTAQYCNAHTHTGHSRTTFRNLRIEY